MSTPELVRGLARHYGVYVGAFLVLALLPVLLVAWPGARRWRDEPC